MLRLHQKTSIEQTPVKPKDSRVGVEAFHKHASLNSMRVSWILVPSSPGEKRLARTFVLEVPKKTGGVWDVQ